VTGRRRKEVRSGQENWRRVVTWSDRQGHRFVHVEFVYTVDTSWPSTPVIEPLRTAQNGNHGEAGRRRAGASSHVGQQNCVKIKNYQNT
jgi:hypothetical protein